MGSIPVRVTKKRVTPYGVTLFLLVHFTNQSPANFQFAKDLRLTKQSILDHHRADQGSDSRMGLFRFALNTCSLSRRARRTRS